jgi:hypothetical protein
LTRRPTHAREEYFPIAFYMWLQEVLTVVDTVQETQPSPVGQRSPRYSVRHLSKPQIKVRRLLIHHR